MPKRRIGKLNNCENVGLEMQRVYRQLRRNEIEASYAKSLIYILSQIVTVHRDTDIEQRVQAIEEYR
jgi:hypothetical protein